MEKQTAFDVYADGCMNDGPWRWTNAVIMDKDGGIDERMDGLRKMNRTQGQIGR